MNIGIYSFSQFRKLAEDFHGYAAPGLLVGGYMVELGKGLLPDGTLFEAVAETGKCLPDAVQLLTLCSTGNQRLHIHDLGLYAVSLYDKHTGKGVRVSIDPARLYAYPEIRGWFMKEKPKQAQDIVELEREIETAGHTICKVQRVRIDQQFLGHGHMGTIGICPRCGEAYPLDHGALCLGCQGQAPYTALDPEA
jgi:formylmethanofuran dehydrogenase subunit E